MKKQVFLLLRQLLGQKTEPSPPSALVPVRCPGCLRFRHIRLLRRSRVHSVSCGSCPEVIAVYLLPKRKS
jgi:hypothetical protein